MYFPHAFWTAGSSSSLMNDLLVFWNLNDAEPPGNTTVVDSLGNFNATIFGSNTTYRDLIDSVPGQIGTAFFNNTPDCVESAYIHVSDPLNKFNLNVDKTFVLWIRTDIAGAGSSIVNYAFGKYFVDAPNPQYLAQINDGQLMFTVVNTDPVEFTANTPSVIANDIWYFAVFKHDSVNKRISVQLNNGTIYSTTYTGTLRNLTQNFRLIEDCSQGILIDAFSIWDRLLAPSEITYLYNNGVGREYPL